MIRGLLVVALVFAAMLALGLAYGPGLLKVISTVCALAGLALAATHRKDRS